MVYIKIYVVLLLLLESIIICYKYNYPHCSRRVHYRYASRFRHWQAHAQHAPGRSRRCQTDNTQLTLN